MEYSQTINLNRIIMEKNGLNPYSNGILTNIFALMKRSNAFGVLILILMEYSQTQFMGGNRFGIQVLILILMEYSQTLMSCKASTSLMS